MNYELWMIITNVKSFVIPVKIFSFVIPAYAGIQIPCQARNDKRTVRNDRKNIITISFVIPTFSIVAQRFFLSTHYSYCHSRVCGNPDSVSSTEWQDAGNLELIASKEIILIMPTLYKNHPNQAYSFLINGTKYHSLYFLSEQKVNKNSPTTIKRLKIDYKKLKIKQLAKSSNNLFSQRFL